MKKTNKQWVLGAALVAALAAVPVHADEQSIPAGVPEEGELSTDSGSNGLCETTAGGDDVQLVPVGSAAPNRPAIRCGGDGVVGTTAAGDDVQLRPVGSYCGGGNVPIIDTGANGIPETAPGSGDNLIGGITVGVAPSDTPCVSTGPDGISNSTAAGDDAQQIANGSGNADQAVVLCGDDLIPSTTANNMNPSGDDTQEIPVSTSPTCSNANDVVVRSGPTNSVSDTRAEGAELILKVGKAVKATIAAGETSVTRPLKIQVTNQEFGASSPATRSYRLEADDGSCPDGTLRFLDADPATDGLQDVGTIVLGGSAKPRLSATFFADAVRTVSTRVPQRCEATITVIAIDTDPEQDDARQRRNNTITVDFEVLDRNDTP